MSQHSKQDISPSGGMIFIAAAWYGFLIPVITPVIWFLITVITDGRLGVAFMSAFCILVTSFIIGFASLLGFSRRNRKGILWIAVVGVLSSAALGYISLVFWNMSQTWHG